MKKSYERSLTLPLKLILLFHINVYRALDSYFILFQYLWFATPAYPVLIHAAKLREKLQHVLPQVGLFYFNLASVDISNGGAMTQQALPVVYHLQTYKLNFNCKELRVQAHQLWFPSAPLKCSPLSVREFSFGKAGSRVAKITPKEILDQLIFFSFPYKVKWHISKISYISVPFVLCVGI